MNRPGVSSSRRASLAFGVASIAFLTAACGGGAAPGDGTAAAGAITAADLVHIHRLQDVPDGDGLFVATHTGLFRVDDGDIEAVGGATHDLMGFTVAGADDLLASGHPDLRVDELMVEGKPPLLGLVQSSDGQTWTPLSLLGEVDFHSLVNAHDQVYGLDSQTGNLLVSTDRQNWETRGKALPFVDLAVSPDDPDVLVATTQSGIARSDDGGRSWSPVSDQRVAYLSWTAGGLFGVSPEGSVARSDDEGRSWQSRGNAGGAPAALLVTDEAVYVAVHEAGIVRSTDDGQTFEFVLRTDKG